MILTRHFGALAARPTFADGRGSVSEQRDAGRRDRDVEPERVEHRAAA